MSASVLEARKRQLVGVQLLKLEMQRLRDPSSVLSAAQMLLFSELYTETLEDSDQWKSWYTHLHAMAVVNQTISHSEHDVEPTCFASTPIPTLMLDVFIAESRLRHR